MTPEGQKDWPYSTRPECRVVRTGVSPMNPKVKWAQLSCGHDVFRTRKPRVGATIICPECARKADCR